jgi:DNA-binding transcriptional LysR family regulator
MDMRQIQYFLTVARSLNFTNAANELQISQATLSRQISAMESELNLLLFFRDNRNVRLTQSGEYLYQELSKLYGNYRSIVDNAKKIFEGYNGQLTFGVLEETTLMGTMQDSIYRYQHVHPNHTLNFKRSSFKGLTDGLLDFSIDFAITLFFDISTLTNLQYKIISRSIDGILISNKHPLAKKSAFYPKDFQNQTFILISDSDSRYASNGAIDYCTRCGFYPKLRIAPDLDTAMLWVEAGLGIAFTHQNAISVLNPSMTFIPFGEKEQVTGATMVLVWNPSNTNPAIPSFLKEFEKAVGKSIVKMK